MLKVDKQQLLNTKLTDDFNEIKDDFGHPCVKCAFLQAAGIDTEHEQRAYFSTVGNYNGHGFGLWDPAWRDPYSEVCKVLDTYEKHAIEYGEADLNQLVQDLEGLVEWV